jgi:hypothetical protein
MKIHCTRSTGLYTGKNNLRLVYKKGKILPLKTSQPDLKNIIKELKTLEGKIDKLEKIVESKLVGEVKPDEYERKAIA